MGEFLDAAYALLGVEDLPDYECVRCRGVLTKVGFIVHRLVCRD